MEVSEGVGAAHSYFIALNRQSLTTIKAGWVDLHNTYCKPGTNSDHVSILGVVIQKVKTFNIFKPLLFFRHVKREVLIPISLNGFYHKIKMAFSVEET